MEYQNPLQQPKPPKHRGALYRLGRRRMPVYVLVVACCAILLMGWSLASRFDQGIDDLRFKIDQGDDLVFEKEREVLRLAEQVRLSTTDQFIASEARTKYGFLFPGEIRFVVTNPEVLGLPPRTQ